MGRRMQPLMVFRLLTGRYPRLFNALRLTMVFFAAFGGAYGFISGSRSPQSGYDPHAFSIGVSFLFALSCVALAALTLRNRLLKRAIRNVTAQNEALSRRVSALEAERDDARVLDVHAVQEQGDDIREAQDVWLIGQRTTEPHGRHRKLTRNVESEQPPAADRLAMRTASCASHMTGAA